jgi:hypothetical protein
MHLKAAAALALVLAAGSLTSSALGHEPPAGTGPSIEPVESPSPGIDPGQSPSVDATPRADAVDGLAFAEPAWSLIDTRGGGPAGREDHTLTVDADGRFAYLFGGRDGGQVFDDLWRLDLATDTWERLPRGDRRPAARFGHSAVWAEGHGLVVFAGQRGTDFFGDLWAYDPDADRWTELPARGAVPRARYGSCMIVGPDDRLWVSHGFTFAGRFDDTRAYDLVRQRWTSIAPDDRRPGPRCLHECFTTADGQLVLYGGQDDDDRALGDLWVTRDDGSWRRSSTPSARPRRLHAVAVADDFAWVFGGAGHDDVRLDDLWRVDRATLDFEPVRVAGATPPARYAATLIADAPRQRLLLFGGQGQEARADLWQLTDARAEPTDPLP